MARDQHSEDVVGEPKQADEFIAAAARPSARRGGLKTFSSLQNNPDYRYLFTGNLFANAAQWLQFITIGWLALDISGSAFHSIMAVAVRALPTLLLGPWAGVMADRIDRRKLAMITQVGIGAAALIFAFLVAQEQVTSVWYLYAYTLVTGVFFAIKQPVRQALIAGLAVGVFRLDHGSHGLRATRNSRRPQRHLLLGVYALSSRSIPQCRQCFPRGGARRRA